LGMRGGKMRARDDEARPDEKKKLQISRMRLFVVGLYVVIAAIWAGLAFSAKGEAQIWSFLLVALFLFLAAINLLAFRKSPKRKDGAT